MSRLIDRLKPLLKAFEQPGSCFVLGAGASWPLVPVGSQLADKVRERGLLMPSYPTYRMDRDILGTRMLGSTAESAPVWDDHRWYAEDLLWHVSPGAVRAIVTAYLCPAAHQRIPPQYDVFNLAKHSLGLINFNNDGLASKYCRRHRVINVHGTGFTAEDKSRIDMEWWINIHQEYPGLSFIGVPGLHLPLPEVPELARLPAYGAVDDVLNRSDHITIVGYSFGRGDDSVAYDKILRALQKSGVSAVVLSPEARDLVEQMMDQSKNDAMIALPLRWDVLAAAIMASSARARSKTCSHSTGFCPSCVLYLYDVFLDSALQWEELAERYELTEFVNSQVELDQHTQR